MVKKTGLGKGLDALIPSSESYLPPGGVTSIVIEHISPNPRQPRARIDPQEMADLAASIQEPGVIQPLIVTRVGKSRVAVTNTLRLLNLPASVKQALVESRITEGHARALLGLPTTQAQDAALTAILKRDLSVRQAEELVRKMLGARPSSPPTA